MSNVQRGVGGFIKKIFAIHSPNHELTKWQEDFLKNIEEGKNLAIVPDPEKFPVRLKGVIVGYATKTGHDGIMDIVITNDEAAETIKKNTLGGVSASYSVVDEVAPMPSSEASEPDYVFLQPSLATHRHFARQHRDGKEPWCDFCRLTAEFKIPENKFGKKE